MKNARFLLTCRDLLDNVRFRSSGPRSNLYAVGSPTTFRFVRLTRLLLMAGSLILLASSAAAQSVTTWHNDNYRTGQQLDETVLTPSTVTQSAFGLLWQNSVQGN